LGIPDPGLVHGAVELVQDREVRLGNLPWVLNFLLVSPGFGDPNHEGEELLVGAELKRSIPYDVSARVLEAFG